MDVLGTNVKKLRNIREMTQEKLAEASTLCTFEISRIERGKVDIRLSTLDKLAKGLGVLPSQLILPAISPEVLAEERKSIILLELQNCTLLELNFLYDFLENLNGYRTKKEEELRNASRY